MNICWRCGSKLIKQPKEFKQQKITYFKCEKCGEIKPVMPRNRSL